MTLWGDPLFFIVVRHHSQLAGLCLSCSDCKLVATSHGDTICPPTQDPPRASQTYINQSSFPLVIVCRCVGPCNTTRNYVIGNDFIRDIYIMSFLQFIFSFSIRHKTQIVKRNSRAAYCMKINVFFSLSLCTSFFYWVVPINNNYADCYVSRETKTMFHVYNILHASFLLNCIIHQSPCRFLGNEKFLKQAINRQTLNPNFPNFGFRKINNNCHFISFPIDDFCLN